MIVFYEENSLTSVDSVFYCLKRKKSTPPIHIVDKDLILSIPGDYREKLALLDGLHRSGLLDFTKSLEDDDLFACFGDFIEHFEGRSILSLAKDVSAWADINLRVLFSECEKIKYTDTDRSRPFEDYLPAFPEFLLDTGEFLEEYGTLVSIKDIGVLNLSHRYSSPESFKAGLHQLLMRFLDLERITEVHHIMSSTQHLENAFKNLLSIRLKDISWEWLGCKDVGEAGFLSAFEPNKDLKEILNNFHEIYMNPLRCWNNNRAMYHLGYYKKVRVRITKPEGLDREVNEIVECIYVGNDMDGLLDCSGSEPWEIYVAKVFEPKDTKLITNTKTHMVIDFNVYLKFVV